MIDEKLNDDSEAKEFTFKVSDKYDYLAIGNSITLHSVTDFWWSEDGMAASKPEFDYYHKIVQGLGDDINSGVYNYSIWETQSHDRSETYLFLDKWLVEGIDLVTIQLSENCSSISTFSEDFKSLILHIKEKSPDSQIIVIDDIWSEEKHNLIEKVCIELKLDFVDLSDIRNDQRYQVGLGTVVFGDDGKEHVIDHEGVAIHPNDEGMYIIAERVLKLIGVSQ